MCFSEQEHLKYKTTILPLLLWHMCVQLNGQKQAVIFDTDSPWQHCEQFQKKLNLEAIFKSLLLQKCSSSSLFFL